jgi:hypothetical protein
LTIIQDCTARGNPTLAQQLKRLELADERRHQFYEDCPPANRYTAQVVHAAR